MMKIRILAACLGAALLLGAARRQTAVRSAGTGRTR